ncbi:ABC transporter substrate-binding protein [Paucibacter sp. R3-3]|uniref:ABC transporter substrate-binding protein n=1 Tax=Roseateles agri TaxID=3098619 RepID=A0ABU5DFN9_9BURK|nr:ABC transporter substrate-binding protein [Paucibacter sp. R3-3]MDY0745101.1 ABC transporter substrate-binding protein [Paucibacter sp. R3-3]
MSIRRRHLLLGALPTALPAWAQTPRRTLVQAMAIDDMISLDPAENFEISGSEMIGNLYERLVQFDLDDPSRLSGQLAEGWSLSADGRGYDFRLREGLRFASGNPLTAAEAVYSLQRAVRLNKTPAFILTQLGWSAANVAQMVRQTGPLSLSLSVREAFAPSFVLNCLSSTVASVVDQRIVQARPEGWLRRNSAGSAPWVLRDWRAAEIVVLDRNEAFHGTKPRIERAIYSHVKESSMQRLMLVRGDVDVARNLSPQDIQALAANPQIKLTRVAKGTVYYISLNQKNAYLARPEVREAFKWLVDYEALGATLIQGIGRPHQNFLPHGLLGASDAAPYKLDVARAKALLAKAGLLEGFTVTMDVRSSQPVQGIAEAVQQWAGRAGIRIEILPGDGKQTLTRYRARKHDLYIGEWGADYWDPHTNADTFARNPDNSDGAAQQPLAWRNAWDIPQLTRETDAALLERDTARRAADYERLQARFRAESPFVMIYQQQQVAAARAGVEGLRLGPTSDTTFLAPVSKR